MEPVPRDEFGWPVTGEHLAVDSDRMDEAIVKHYKNRVESMLELLPADHELATKIDGKEVLAEGLSFTRDSEGGFIAERKTAIIAVSASAITVAGVLLARHYLRPRQKPKD